MIFNKDAIRIRENYNIKLTDAVLVKIEDSIRKQEELLITIAASHYGFLNGNDVVYRHDTVKNNIGTFIHPNPKPIITNHRPTTSKKFGSIIAVDYKLTDYYHRFLEDYNIEDLTTEEYINLCKEHIIPFQRKNSNYDGLAYCETVGKLNDAEGIKNVLSKEFLTVSIGADPRKLVCSHCLQDQVEDICEHFRGKRNGLFMLAEELEYEELSFLTGKKPADPNGKVTRIHDGVEEEFEYELEDKYLNATIDTISVKDFFKLADETKTIVCMENICKVINREEVMGRKKEEREVVSVSYVSEFGDKLKEIKIQDAELTEEDQAKLNIEDSMEDSQFAIIQKAEDKIKRRFPLHDELNVKMALAMIDKAEDLTPAELTKAQASISKAAKKLGIEIPEKEAETKKETKMEDNEVEKVVLEPKTVEDVIGELRQLIESIEETKLRDEEGRTPISAVFDMLSSLSNSLKWAGEALESNVNYYLTEKGKEAVNKGFHDSLNDELKEAKEEISLLEELNRDLNVLARESIVNEIVDAKEQLGLLKDSVEDEKEKLFKHPYNILVEQVSDFRQLKDKFNKDIVNNNKETKEITSVEDPTLKDAVEDEVENSNEEKKELETKAYSEADIKRLMKMMFTK